MGLKTQNTLIRKANRLLRNEAEKLERENKHLRTAYQEVVQDRVKLQKRLRDLAKEGVVAQS